MPNCSIEYAYTPWHKKAFEILAVSVPVITKINIIATCLTLAFICVHRQMRTKNICSMKLFLFNLAECIYTLAQTTTTSRKYSSMHSKSHLRVLSVCQLGQIIAIGFITHARIQQVSGSMTAINTVVRVPGRGRRQTRTFTVILISVIVNILLSVFITKLVPLYATFALIDLILYIVLLVNLSRLKTIVGGAVMNLRKKALTYVTMLFMGFIVEITVTIFLGTSHQEELTSNCQPMLSVFDVILYHVLESRFLWDALAFFIFNADPRRKITDSCKQLREKLRRRRSKIHGSDVAVVPYNDENL